MTTQNPIDIINVTADVYDSVVAKAHYLEELKHAMHPPMIWRRPTTIKGEKRIAYSVCRPVLTAADQLFYDDMVALEKRQRRTVIYPFHGQAKPTELFYLDEKNELQPIGATIQ